MLKEFSEKCVILIVSTSLLGCAGRGCAGSGARVNEVTDTLQSLLLSWPLSKPGDPIPANVIAAWKGDYPSA